MPNGGAPDSLKHLCRGKVAPPTLVAHLSILVAARVPLIVAGGAGRAIREQIADAFTSATLLPEGVSDYEIADGERFAWLADPAGVGCTIEGAGAAPRSPRSMRLRARGLIEALEPTVARSLLRSLVRGYQLITTAAAPDLASLLQALRSTPYRIPEDDLLRLGAILFVLLEAYLPSWTQFWQLPFGIVVVLIVVYLRGGLVDVLGRTRVSNGGGH